MKNRIEIFEHGRVIKYTGDVKTVFALKNAIELFFPEARSPCRCDTY